MTFGEGAGRVGVLEGEEIAVLGVPTMREYFERGGADETGERVSLAETRLRAPVIPKKFFHTAGNFREHDEESQQVNWSHNVAWIVFFQNFVMVVRRARRVPRAPDRGAGLRARPRGRDRQAREVVLAGGGDGTTSPFIYNDITARDIQRREMSPAISFCKAIDTFCPLGPWIVTPTRFPTHTT